MKRLSALSAFTVAFAGAMFVLCLPTAHGQAPSAERAVSTPQVVVDVPAVLGRSVGMGRSNPERVLHVSVSIPPADPQGLQAFADGVSDPSSPNYRQFLTPEQVGSLFGASQQVISKLTDYLKSQGFAIRLVAKNRMSVLADCTVSQAEAAFNTQIDDFVTMSPNEAGNRRFFSYSQPLRVPAAVQPYILDVTGLENFTKPQYRALTPTQTRTLYNVASIYNAGMHGEGRVVGISNWDGFRLSNVPLYYSKYGLPTPPGGVGSNITVIPISGGAGGGTPGAEGDLDIPMVLGMAPLCSLRVYDGGSSDLIGVLTAEVNDNLVDIVSESYGWSLSASTATAAHNLHLSMTAQGITYMAASGDSGTSLEPYSYPNYDPEVMMVGGTVATVDGSGVRTSEVGWSGSGGGWSNNTASFNIRPSWQVGTNVPTNINHRLSPDVALHASSSSGAYSFYFNGTLTSGYIGTSFASPVFAGSLAVAEQKIISLNGLPPNGAGKRRFGRLQDLIYSQNGRSDVWFDIVSGSNGRLPNGVTANAGPAWDYVTGWGAINFDAFVATQVSATPGYSLTATPASRSVVQGTSTTYTATVTPSGGFTGTVTLSASGLPTGASASFNPASLTSGNSTMSVTTSASTPTGSYPLTITGTSGSLVHTASVTLAVTAPPAPNFSLSASPSSVSVSRRNPNGGANTTITVTPTSSFTGTVALSASGLPSGVTATFTPTSVTGGSGTSTLNLRPSSSSPRGTFTITVRGVSGTLTHTTTVSLQINR